MPKQKLYTFILCGSAQMSSFCALENSLDFYQSNMHRCKKGEVNKSLRPILESFLLVVSSSAWTTAFTACCRPRHPLKVSNGAGVFPVPHPAQLVTVLSHRKHSSVSASLVMRSFQQGLCSSLKPEQAQLAPNENAQTKPPCKNKAAFAAYWKENAP